MIAWISMFLPPLIIPLIKKKKFKKEKNVYDQIIDYFLNVLFINLLIICVLNFVLRNSGNIVYKLNNYSDFASKYILLALVFSVGIAYVEELYLNKISICCDFSCAPILRGKTLAWLYAIILFGLNLIRIFDDNLWGDEAFSANIIQKSFGEIVSITAMDVHPPLYYFILRISYLIFGKHGWVFHFVSLIPCFIILVFAMTIIWKKVAPETSLTLITLACLSSNAITYNVEVRMYSWAALFVLFSFYELYAIMQNDKIINYILFTLFSIAAAYTHYYALLSVALFYFVAIIYSIWLKKFSIKKILLVCIASVILYLPWLGYLAKTVMSKKDDFWITTIPSFEESVNFLFSYQMSPAMWLLFIIGLLIAVLYETNLLKISIEKGININFTFKDFQISNSCLWIIAGLVSVLGTIICGIMVSNVLRPLYLLRYIYPVSVVAWMILGIVISKLKGKRLYITILLVYMMITFIPIYSNTYIREKSSNDLLQNTLIKTKNSIQKDDIILTNSSHIEWTIAQYYYTGTEVLLMNENIVPYLEKNKKYWLILDVSQNVEIIEQQLQEQNYSYEKIVDDGELGTIPVDIYSVKY